MRAIIDTLHARFTERLGLLRYEDIEDVVSIALWRLWDARTSYDDTKQSLRVWFYSIAENVAKDVLKHGWHKARRIERNPGQEWLEQTQDHTRPVPASPKGKKSGKEKKKATDLDDVLSQLPEAQHKIVMADSASRDGNASNEFLADELGIPAAHVRVYRGLRVRENPNRNEEAGALHPRGDERHTMIPENDDKPVRDLIADVFLPPDICPSDPKSIEAMLDAANDRPMSDDQIERMLKKAKGDLPVGVRDMEVEGKAWIEDAQTEADRDLVALHRNEGAELPADIEEELKRLASRQRPRTRTTVTTWNLEQARRDAASYFAEQIVRDLGITAPPVNPFRIIQSERRRILRLRKRFRRRL